MAEILSPAGSPKALEAALRCGCDAVYVGGRRFSARAAAANFSDGELEQAVRLCHIRGVKLYLAINTLVFDNELEECKRAVEFAARIGVDGIITQDLCLIRIVKRCCPQMKLHASTQMSLHTKNGVLLAKELGFSRVVLSRELPKQTISQLSHLGTETEIFVHTALCLSVSGQCYMSALIGSRSANRGACAQSCRLAVSAVKGHERYDLSLKDMSLLDVMDSVLETGVSSLKIEGRMKRPEYVAKATDSCVKACNGADPDMSGLAAVFSRSGFTRGYFEGRRSSAMFGRRQKEDLQLSASVQPQIHGLYRSEFKRDKVRFVFTAKQGCQVCLTAYDSHSNSFTARGDISEKAKGPGLTSEQVQKQLRKLGDTIYEFDSCECEIENGLYVSPAQINALRRRVCEGLDEQRAMANDRRVSFENAEIADFDGECVNCEPKIRIVGTSIEQLEKIDIDVTEFVILPLSACENGGVSAFGRKLMAQLPRFTFDEHRIVERLEALKQSGLKHILATNLAHLRIGRELGLYVHTDFGLNVTNSVAVKMLAELGAVDVTASIELKAAQIRDLKRAVPVGVLAYGRLDAMLTANCPIKQACGCSDCKGLLYDPTGREFAVRCSKNEGYVEILNSDTLFLADKKKDFTTAAFMTLCLDKESPEQAAQVVQAYRHGTKLELEHMTRGLYYRGIT